MIKDERVKKRITQQELANMVGCSKAMIVAIERGDKTPSLGLAGKLSKALKKTVDSLFFAPNSNKL